ncbi:MAG: YrzE family protein [Bacillota bacterium]|jgi:hypothetical protein
MKKQISYIPYKGRGRNANMMIIMGIVLFCLALYLLYSAVTASPFSVFNLIIVLLVTVFLGGALIKNIRKNRRLDRGLLYIKLMMAGRTFSIQWLAERTRKSYDEVFVDFQYLLSRGHFPGSTIDIPNGEFVPPPEFVMPPAKDNPPQDKE